MGEGRNLDITQTGDGLWLVAGPSRARLARLGTSVVRIDFEGHGHERFAPTLTKYLTKVLEETPRLYLGVDAEAMCSYDGRFRYLWTEWFKQHLDALEGVLVLFRSPVILSGTIIVNAVAGRRVIEACAERDRFEERLEAVLAGDGAPRG
jgi:hypothetical protein